jgi:hypothetical protein
MEWKTGWSRTRQRRIEGKEVVKQRSKKNSWRMRRERIGRGREKINKIIK